MSKIRGQTFTELYQELNMKEGENNIYKMAKLWEMKTKNFNQVKYIKDKADRLFDEGWWD
jgi:hypothetical protein